MDEKVIKCIFLAMESHVYQMIKYCLKVNGIGGQHKQVKKYIMGINGFC